MKNLLSLLVVGVVCWVVYVTFMGSDADRQKRDQLFQGLKTTGSAISDILQSEKGKLNAGEYDKAIDLVSGAISSLKKDSKEAGLDNSAQISELEKLQAELNKKVGLYNKAQLAIAQVEEYKKTTATQKKSSKGKVVEYDKVPPTVPPAPSQEELNADLQKINDLLTQMTKE